MKQSDKEALKEAFKYAGLVAAILFAAVITALVVLAVMQVNTIAGFVVFMVCVCLFGGIIAFFLIR